jgi:hypothetical protein
VCVAGADSVPPRRRCAGGSAILNRAGVAALVASMTLAACGGTATPSTGGTAKTGASSGDPIGTVPTPESSTCNTAPALDPSTFPDPLKIDNPYLPMTPGMQFVLDGVSVDKGRSIPHKIETTVTNLTKMVDGVRTLVVFERDFQAGVLQEQEINFSAQDRDGAVWLFGEYPEEYTNGILKGAPATWLAGVQGANAGISMLAGPRTGTPTYVQGIAPEVAFHDCATVIKDGLKVCTKLRCYDKAVMIDEYAPSEPGNGHQQKLLAPGYSTVKVSNGSGIDIEYLELVSSTRVCGPAMDKFVAQTQQEDQRAYTVSKQVWQGSSPVEATLPPVTC